MLSEAVVVGQKGEEGSQRVQEGWGDGGEEEVGSHAIGVHIVSGGEEHKVEPQGKGLAEVRHVLSL